MSDATNPAEVTSDASLFADVKNRLASGYPQFVVVQYLVDSKGMEIWNAQQLVDAVSGHASGVYGPLDNAPLDASPPPQNATSTTAPDHPLGQDGLTWANYRPADSTNCGTCASFLSGLCLNFSTDSDPAAVDSAHTCDAWVSGGS